jgi:hypothetical protein
VQSDVDQAKRRCTARDGGDAAAEAFWREWMDEERPFLARERPWERADVVVVNVDRHDGIGGTVTATEWRSRRRGSGPEDAHDGPRS